MTRGAFAALLLAAQHGALTVPPIPTTGDFRMRRPLTIAVIAMRAILPRRVAVLGGVVGALLGASGVFGELDTALNRIFASERPMRRPVKAPGPRVTATGCSTASTRTPQRRPRCQM